jgi:cyclopropane fatty-acyl-phospholipid synthase-like methyltransferase
MLNNRTNSSVPLNQARIQEVQPYSLPARKAIAYYYRELHFSEEMEVLRRVFDEYIGQRSWALKSDFEDAAKELRLEVGSHLLDYGCGFGGPTMFLARLTGCDATGFDINVHAIAVTCKRAAKQGLGDQMQFVSSFEEAKNCAVNRPFSAILMNDVICHVPNRLDTFQNCYSTLSLGGRILITDPLVLTGVLSAKERRIRNAHIPFYYAAPDYNEKLLQAAGFQLLRTYNSTHRLIELTGRYLNEYDQRKDGMIRHLGVEEFKSLMERLTLIHDTAKEGRLSRFTYLGEK